MDKFCRAVARALKSLGGTPAQFVDAAVDIGVVILVKPAQGVDDGSGLLRSGGIVQIDERMSMNLLVKDGKILAQAFHVKNSGAD